MLIFHFYCCLNHRSLTGRDIEIYFDDKKDGLLYAYLRPGQVVSTNAYPSHEFYVTAAGHKDLIILRFIITSDQVCLIYQIHMCIFVCGLHYILKYLTCSNSNPDP